MDKIEIYRLESYVLIKKKNKKWKMKNELFELVYDEMTKGQYGIYSQSLVDRKIFPNNIKELKYIIENDTPKTKTALVEITNKCNLKCKYCYNSSFNYIQPFKELSFENIKLLVDKCIYSGVRHICLTGGEPTQHSEFEQIIHYLDTKPIKYSINTNLFFDTDKLNCLLQSNTCMVKVGLCSIKAETYKKITGTSEPLQLILSNLLSLNQASTNTVRVSIVLNKHNVKELPAYTQWLESNGIKYILDYMVLDRKNKYIDELNLNIDDYVLAVSNLLKNNYSKGKISNYQRNRFCDFMHSMIYINVLGDVMLCPSDPLQIKLGHFYFIEIDKIFDCLEDIPYYEDQCEANCRYFTVCKGGCRTRAFLLNNELNSQDTVMCKLIEKLFT